MICVFFDSTSGTLQKVLSVHQHFAAFCGILRPGKVTAKVTALL